MENNFSLFWLCFTYTLMPHNIMLYFHLPYFHISSTVYFSHSTPVLSFYTDRRSLDTLYWVKDTLRCSFSQCYLARFHTLTSNRQTSYNSFTKMKWKGTRVLCLTGYCFRRRVNCQFHMNIDTLAYMDTIVQMWLILHEFPCNSLLYVYKIAWTRWDV